jgi:hypothetical protein
VLELPTIAMQPEPQAPRAPAGHGRRAAGHAGARVEKAKVSAVAAGNRTTEARSRRRASAPRVRPRTFAWAPAAGASSYRIRIIRGRTTIFAAVSTRPRLRLPRSWTYRGRVNRLTRGRYRWVVRPVRRGREGAAIVRARLNVAA